MRCFIKSAHLVPNDALIGVRRFHSSRINMKKVVREIRFPYLKDKTPIVKTYHKNKNLPFNAMRDVLKFPVMSPDSLDGVSFAWMDYFTMGDETVLLDQMSQMNTDLFWLKTIRVAISDETLLAKVVSLLKYAGDRDSIKVSSSISEIMVASLLYVGKYEQAFYVFKDLLGDKCEINWEPILSICLSLEDAGPLRVLEAIHKERGGQLYNEIIPHLQKLKVKENYIHSWNNKLVGLGDFPKDSSVSMNSVFKGMVETGNFKSFDHCLRHIAAQLDNPSKWLDNETSKYITKYIIYTKDQESTFKTVIGLFGPKSFQKQFYVTLLYQSKIPTKTLMTFTVKAGFSENDPAVIEANCKRLAVQESAEFWNYTNEIVDKLPPLKVSLQILSMYLRDSINLYKGYSFATHLIQQYPLEKDFIAKTFILESTSKILDTNVTNDLIVEFEKYLEEQGLMNDKIQNYLIFSDLRLFYFKSAIERIESLLSNPDSVVDKGTIDHTFRILTNDSARIPMNFAKKDESSTHFIMRLVLRMHKHCDDVSALTWNKLLRQVVLNFDHSEGEKFCLEIADYVKFKSNLNFNSANGRHPLRLVFDDKLIKQILIGGFSKADAPWCGLELLSKLQSKGVYVPKNLLKKHIIQTLSISGLPNSERNKISSTKVMTSNLPLESIVNKINEIEQQM